jgi:hypothetical protein
VGDGPEELGRELTAPGTIGVDRVDQPFATAAGAGLGWFHRVQWSTRIVLVIRAAWAMISL